MKLKFIQTFAVIAVFFAVNASAQQAGDPGGKPQPKVISGGVVNGKAINLVKPPYPAAARAVRASGAVNVQVTIDEDGNVISATAVSGHPLLRAAAVDAARQSKFTPTILSGQYVKVTGVVVYNFVPPKSIAYKTDAEMFVPLGIPLFLTSMKLGEPDDEGRALYAELGESLPAEFSNEKAELKRLSKARSKADRDRLVDSVVNSFLSTLSGTDLWFAELGKAWGDAVVATGQVAENNNSTNRRRFDRMVTKVNEILADAPEDVPPAFLAKVRGISAFDDEQTAQSEQFVLDFLQGSLEFIKSVVKNR